MRTRWEFKHGAEKRYRGDRYQIEVDEHICQKGKTLMKQKEVEQYDNRADLHEQRGDRGEMMTE